MAVERSIDINMFDQKDDERWVLCGLNNRLLSRYWTMG
jgi:hypothetical protein